MGERERESETGKTKEIEEDGRRGREKERDTDSRGREEERKREKQRERTEEDHCGRAGVTPVPRSDEAISSASIYQRARPRGRRSSRFFRADSLPLSLSLSSSLSLFRSRDELSVRYGVHDASVEMVQQRVLTCTAKRRQGEDRYDEVAENVGPAAPHVS